MIFIINVWNFFTEKDKEEKIEKTIEDEMEKILINLEELRIL